MEIKAKFDHFNINVTNLERSIAFYEKALGLKEHHRKEASNGSFTLVYLTDNSTGFLLELTCLKDHPQAYELGENESHLCFRVAGDYEAIHQYHKEMGWVCFENTAMGLYFIHDPDDYWIEVLPANDERMVNDDNGKMIGLHFLILPFIILPSYHLIYDDLPFSFVYPPSSWQHRNHVSR